MAINFNGNREPKDYIFTLGFLHVCGSILMFNVQVADPGSSVCAEGMSLCRRSGRAAPAHDLTCQLNHLGDFSYFKICVRKTADGKKTSVPRIWLAMPSQFCMNLLVAFFIV